jgi:hypothetical protein
MASCEAPNAALRRLIDSLTNRTHRDSFLSAHFHDMICRLALRINDAFDCLCDLEKSVRLRHLTWHELLDDKCDKTRALLVNDSLIGRALFQEQQILVTIWMSNLAERWWE